ncbi:MAG TPA: hypothetical protein VIS06_00465 [Mycobacteriales bacterium]
MESPERRTVFGSRYADRGLARKAVLIGVIGFVIVALGTAVGHGSIVVPALAPLSAVFLVGGGLRLTGRTHPYRIALDPGGVEVQARGRTSRLSWSDVSAWGVGDPVGGRARGRVPAVLAWPAAHVTDPAAGGAAAIWSGRARAWVVCLPHQTDGTVEEITGAFALVAPQLPYRDGN